MKKTIISPSMLSANFADLKSDIEMINKSSAEYFHIDVMDGVFVPNISFGFPVIKAINKLAQKPLDVHLMIIDPDRYILNFKEVGAEILTVHYEACTHLHRTIQNIKQNGMKAGVALNPHTPIEVLQDIITDCDLILIMSVNPGFGGQKFIQNTYSKLDRLSQLLEKNNHECLVQVDGGVDNKNAALLFNHGANMLVAGNYIFSASKPIEAIENLKQ